MSQITETGVALPERDGVAPAAQHWSAGVTPRLVLVVAHGMGEHSRRYVAPLSPLIAEGVEVYALDHRGHGASVQAGQVGDFGAGGFAGIVSDLVALVEVAQAQHPGLPLALLGHSMGSFAAQLFVLDHADLIDGLALSGSAALDRLAAVATSPDVLAALNGPFEPSRTPFDWLSRDEDEVDAYIADPLCGFPLTPQSFVSMFEHAPRMADPAVLAAIPKDLPIYIFSGLADPLASALGGLDPLIERYKAAGVPVTTDLYPEGRHEILNETNRAEVVGRLGGWLARLKPRKRHAFELALGSADPARGHERD
jgi:alpha-beta hydrolase superfamily lysophospholipase